VCYEVIQSHIPGFNGLCDDLQPDQKQQRELQVFARPNKFNLPTQDSRPEQKRLRTVFGVIPSLSKSVAHRRSASEDEAEDFGSRTSVERQCVT
jgi:hypothetical protein